MKKWGRNGHLLMAKWNGPMSVFNVIRLETDNANVPVISHSTSELQASIIKSNHLDG